MAAVTAKKVKNMKAIEAAKEVQSKGMTFVEFAAVTQFLGVCNALGIDVCGGAFDNAMTGQWFYI